MSQDVKVRPKRDTFSSSVTLSPSEYSNADLCYPPPKVHIAVEKTIHRDDIKISEGIAEGDYGLDSDSQRESEGSVREKDGMDPLDVARIV